MGLDFLYRVVRNAWKIRRLFLCTLERRQEIWTYRYHANNDLDPQLSVWYRYMVMWIWGNIKLTDKKLCINSVKALIDHLVQVISCFLSYFPVGEKLFSVSFFICIYISWCSSYDFNIFRTLGNLFQVLRSNRVNPDTIGTTESQCPYQRGERSKWVYFISARDQTTACIITMCPKNKGSSMIL